MKLLQRDSTMLLKWFSDKQMKASVSKCYLLVNKKDEVVINLGEMEIKSKLKLNEYLNDIISKASGKLNALSRLVPYLGLIRT